MPQKIMSGVHDLNEDALESIKWNFLMLSFNENILIYVEMLILPTTPDDHQRQIIM